MDDPDPDGGGATAPAGPAGRDPVWAAAAMSERPATPAELREEALAVLDRLRKLDRSAHDGGRLTADAVDAIAGAIADLQRRVEVTARHYNHAWALTDVLAARRHVDAARMIVLGFLAELGADET